VLLASPWAYSQTNDKQEAVLKLDIFPFQSQHVHGSTLVQLPNGDLLAAWFEGSGERQSDDVAIMGARLLKGSEVWTKPFVLADVPDFPDINPVLFIDPQENLWLLWYTVLANQWETSILKYRLSSDYQQPAGPPVWYWQDIIHPKPGGPTEHGIQEDDPFVRSLIRQLATYDQQIPQTMKLYPPEERADLLKRWEERKKELISQARGEDMIARGRITQPDGKTADAQLGYPRFRRMGWQTRNKPLFLPSGRMIVPLYSDGFDFSLMAITDDGGKHWTYSEPLVSLGGVQPALVLRDDGAVVTYMRDNGPPPQRLLTSYSKDEGKTWSPVVDSEIPNPGAGADMVKLADGRWLIIGNDTEDGRNSLALFLSADEGKTWRIIRRLERDLTEGTVMRAHYPAIIQGKNGHVHLTYTYQERLPDGQTGKTIRYATVRKGMLD
jgi:predicted neuraminidase